MLISKESLLRRLPTSLDRREVLYLDGIRYSIEIFELASHRATETLRIIGNSVEDQDISSLIVQAMSDAWVMIDTVHRLRELLVQVPKMKKNEPELQLFLRSTTSIEGLRNFVQHFRSEIDSYSKLGAPLWGTLSWVMDDPVTREPKNHLIIPGTFFNELKAIGCVFDTHEGKFTQRVILQAGKSSIDLADLHESIERFVKWYVGWFETTITGNDRHGADAHLQLTFRPVFQAKPPMPPESGTQ